LQEPWERNLAGRTPKKRRFGRSSLISPRGPYRAPWALIARHHKAAGATTLVPPLAPGARGRLHSGSHTTPRGGRPCPRGLHRARRKCSAKTAECCLYGGGDENGRRRSTEPFLSRGYPPNNKARSDEAVTQAEDLVVEGRSYLPEGKSPKLLEAAM